MLHVNVISFQNTEHLIQRTTRRKLLKHKLTYILYTIIEF